MIKLLIFINISEANNKIALMVLAFKYYLYLHILKIDGYLTQTIKKVRILQKKNFVKFNNLHKKLNLCKHLYFRYKFLFK